VLDRGVEAGAGREPLDDQGARGAQAHAAAALACDDLAQLEERLLESTLRVGQTRLVRVFALQVTMQRNEVEPREIAHSLIREVLLVEAEDRRLGYGSAKAGPACPRPRLVVFGTPAARRYQRLACGQHACDLVDPLVGVSLAARFAAGLH
jgi:hypothetical protein